MFSLEKMCHLGPKADVPTVGPMSVASKPSDGLQMCLDPTSSTKNALCILQSYQVVQAPLYLNGDTQSATSTTNKWLQKVGLSSDLNHLCLCAISKPIFLNFPLHLYAIITLYTVHAPWQIYVLEHSKTLNGNDSQDIMACKNTSCRGEATGIMLIRRIAYGSGNFMERTKVNLVEE